MYPDSTYTGFVAAKSPIFKNKRRKRSNVGVSLPHHSATARQPHVSLGGTQSTHARQSPVLNLTQAHHPTTAGQAPITRLGDRQLHYPASARQEPVVRLGGTEPHDPATGGQPPVIKLDATQPHHPASSGQAPVVRLSGTQPRHPSTAEKATGLSSINVPQLSHPTPCTDPLGLSPQLTSTR